MAPYCEDLGYDRDCGELAFGELVGELWGMYPRKLSSVNEDQPTRRPR